MRKVLKLAGLTLDQIDLVELNEAFAAQALACLQELPIDPERLNVNGGAIALGHPLGCTGAKLTATLALRDAAAQGPLGMVTMCVGGGMGAAGIFETDVDRRWIAMTDRLARSPTHSDRMAKAAPGWSQSRTSPPTSSLLRRSATSIA